MTIGEHFSSQSQCEWKKVHFAFVGAANEFKRF